MKDPTEGALASKPIIWSGMEGQCEWCGMDQCVKNTGQAMTWSWFKETVPKAKDMPVGMKAKGCM